MIASFHKVTSSDMTDSVIGSPYAAPTAWRTTRWLFDTIGYAAGLSIAAENLTVTLVQASRVWPESDLRPEGRLKFCAATLSCYNIGPHPDNVDITLYALRTPPAQHELFCECRIRDKCKTFSSDVALYYHCLNKKLSYRRDSARRRSLLRSRSFEVTDFDTNR